MSLLVVRLLAVTLFSQVNVKGFVLPKLSESISLTPLGSSNLHELHAVKERRHHRRKPSLLQATISLDDEWAVLSNLVTKSTQEIELGKIAKQVAEIQWTKLLAPGPGITQVEQVLSSITAAFLALPPWAEASLVLLPTFVTLITTLYVISFPDQDFRVGYEPYPRGEYDPLQAKVYYSKHPILVLQRALQVLRLSSRYLIDTLLIDKYIFKDEENMRSKRALQLLDLVNKLGPTAIKVGQALSVRGDLIPQEFATALATLQDRVPPFSGDAAKALLLKELGPQRFAQIKDVSFDKGPVASASIGQVYRGFVGDKEVAVKCQRPNALAEIALDLYLVREFAPVYQKLTKSATDFQSLANEWGRGFIAELDYREEAKSTMQFNVDMQSRKLNAVMAPIVVEDFSTERILVTEWVKGVRLDQSTADDVPRLCSVALNAYLVMLLETRRLHCDPHPGNILRTDDGRLCILDFGMTLDTDPSLQYSLLEFVAHLTGEDYSKIPEDLVKLGFLKADRLDTVRASGFLEPLTYMLKQAGEGGGADKVRNRIFSEFREKYPNLPDDELRVQMRADMKQRIEETRKRESAVSGITMEVEELQKRNRDAFRIPEWFVYTSRAFLTLEGVSLQADENFSIIKSCFPYVAKRLLADDSPQARDALRNLLYGAEEYMEPKRLADLADGFVKYTTTTKFVEEQGADEDESAGILLSHGANRETVRSKERNTSAAEAAVTLVKDSADILLAPGGNFVQNLLVEESVLAASAQVKDTLKDTLIDVPQRFRDALPFGIGSVLPKLPLEDGIKPFVRKTLEEEKALGLVVKISSFIPPSMIPFPGSGGPDGGIPINDAAGLESFSQITPEQAAYLAKEFRENAPKYAPLLGRLGSKFAATLLKTASRNIESTLGELERDRQGDDFVNAAAKGISGLASRSAGMLSDDPS
ncbi:phosphotransferase-like protein [Fragilaria crotonensis]|nr:phosphotransferase-like protein [Fragilaria crotonensis]